MSRNDESHAAVLDRILLALTLEATAAQRRQLLTLVDQLQRWNATYNLTAIRDPAAMLVQHVADCLAVIRPLVSRGPSRLLDVGSGAGFPGTVIAVMLPQVEVTCIDSVGKKAAFVRQVSGELGLANLRSEHARVEDYRAQAFDVIASRAFSDLARLTALTASLLADKGVWMAMKGKVPTDEMQKLDTTILALNVEPLVVPQLNAERCLVWISRKEVGPC